MQSHQVLPLAQLGVQLFGRVFPTDSTIFEYALTVSNGRGPMDTIKDLDENKALGLKLKFIYEGDNLNTALGAYGYWGDYTDIKRVIASLTPTFVVDRPITESYTETILTLDLLIQFFGVRLQGEFVRKLVEFEKRAPRVQARGPGFQPNYIAQMGYGLLGYTLPLDKWIGDVTITPFVNIDVSQYDDTVAGYNSRSYGGGFNVRPADFLVLKLDVTYQTSTDGDYLDAWFVMGQVAVSF